MIELPLARALDGAARSLRGMSGLARMIPAIAAATAAAALAAWLLRLGLLGGPLLVLGFWLVSASCIVAGLLTARRAIRRLGPWHVAAELEALGAWRRGALTTLLDLPAPGTSAQLHDAAGMVRAEEVRTNALTALAPVIAQQRVTARRAMGVVSLAIVVLVAARPLDGTPARLWQPVSAWRALTAPVRLSARETTVVRGASAVLELEAVGQQRARLMTRSPGEPWRSEEVQLDAEGRAVVESAPLAADLVARLEAGGRVSAEVQVVVHLPAFLGALSITAEYPPYLGLPNEQLALTGDTLVIPEGTQLQLRGRATAELGAVQLEGVTPPLAFDVQGERFEATLRPRVGGTHVLRVNSRNGGALEGDPPTFVLRLVPDSAPSVEIPVPGVDTVAPASLRLPLVVAVRDDHGLGEAVLEVRRNAGGAPRRIGVTLPTGTTDRALLALELDLVALGLTAGDTLHYAVLAGDNAPSRHWGRSPSFRVRLPTEDEQRAARTRETAATGTALDSLAAEARRLQRQTENLAQERQRAAATSPNGETDPLALESARKGEAVAQAQEQVAAQASQLQRDVDALRRAAEREGLADSALAAQLGEIRKLLEEAISPELREQLAALRESLAKLDAPGTRDALQAMVPQQQRSRDALEQARELFKRAALETSLATMADEAKRLSEAQREATKALGSRDSTSAAKAEQALAKRADSLAAALDRAAEKVPANATKEGLQEAAAQTRQAAEAMQQAAQSAAQGQRSEAQQAGQQAEQQMSSVDQQIREERQEMQAQMREETLNALDRALAETARLAERQVAVAEAFRRGALPGPVRAEQSVLAEGAGKLLEQVIAAGATNALVSPQIAGALAAARRSMSAALEAVSTATPNYRAATEASGESVDALTVAAFALLRARENVDGSESGSGVQEMMEQMQQMAGKQGQLSQDAEGMMQQGGGAMQEMMQLAMQQRALAQQLERMRSQGQMPGAGSMAQEAKEIARLLETGKLDRETVQRQDRLFRKMLDAGRTLQGEEKDENKERQSSTAVAGVLRRPDAMDPRLRAGLDDIRLPGWEALQRLSPDDRRRVLEYFRRLSTGTP